MNCWEILGLEPGTATRDIKRRYASLAKNCRPEDDADAWQKLRDAYEQALEYSTCDNEQDPKSSVDCESLQRDIVQFTVQPRRRMSLSKSLVRPVITLPAVPVGNLGNTTWQRILEKLFEENETCPEQAKTQLDNAISSLEYCDLNSRMQFEEALLVNLQQIFRPLLMLAAAELFKWHLISGSRQPAIQTEINVDCLVYYHIEQSIASYFSNDMTPIEIVENGEFIHNQYQLIIDNEKSKKWFATAILNFVEKYNLPDCYLAFIVERLEWSSQTEPGKQIWQLTQDFYSLSSVHKSSYAKIISSLNLNDGEYTHSKTFDCYLSAAELKHPFSRYKVGVKYFNGIDAPQNYDYAYFWFACAAKQNFTEAQYALGYACEHGLGTEKNYSEAIRRYLLAAKEGHKDAQYYLGCIYTYRLDVPDNIQAHRWFTLAAEQGCPKAQNDLAAIYLEILQNHNQAIYWFEKSAAQGFDLAILNLAQIYEEGNGVTVNKKKSFDYYLQAALNGNSFAQNKIGMLLFNDGEVESNIEQALEWYTRAAEQGFAEAQYNLAGMYIYGNGVAVDYSKAIHWLMLAAEQGLAEAESHLGRIYYDGKIISRDFDKAMHFLTLAAEKHDHEAETFLGNIYYRARDKGISRDLKKAASYFTSAAKNGNANAACLLGSIYIEGCYEIPKNHAEAFYWTGKSARLGNRVAAGILAIMYFEGVGTPQDNISAWAWALNGDLTEKQRVDIQSKLSHLEISKAEQMARLYTQRYELNSNGSVKNND
ncbi:SEL1-like repeat protein [Escherichia fergusonii]|uniref:J domain-containing protein n=1 Tax=Escherichia fergusonii TaxID=564 RepID=UPI0015EA9BAF|nr:J domain-containing protein [Escherichia fergusonii]QME99448.1 SEL1-like repeat protein [Escherichia fergusonii]